MTEIRLFDRDGILISSVQDENEAMLCVDREYREGDFITVSSECSHLIFQPDVAVLPAEIYKPARSMTWKIPCGEHLLAYSPVAFRGNRHLITARPMTEEEIRRNRNIACNPADLRGDTDFYPHCTANVETRGESCFAARNVIDGIRIGNYHGEWPYQSWGIGAREDAWCLLDLGRMVDTDSMALVLRSDFPHDAWWTQGHVVLEDGSEYAFDLKKTGEKQLIRFDRTHRISRLRLERMKKSDDPSAFPALIQWEVYGKDTE